MKVKLPTELVTTAGFVPVSVKLLIRNDIANTFYYVSISGSNPYTL